MPGSGTARLARKLLGDIGDLLEHHERSSSLGDLSRYADRPVAFLREVLDAEPWGVQREIAAALLERPLVTVRSCHAAGKDWLAARLALWWTYARQGLVILTGPTAAQVEEILMRSEIRTAFRGSGLPGDLHVKALRPGGEGKAGILAKTATGVSALTGFHDARVLFIVTEAQDPEIGHAWDAAFACTTGAEDRVLTLGNPTAPSGRFYDAHQTDSAWHAVKIEAADIPNVREGATVVPGLLTREGVERFAEEYGEESGFFVSRVLAEFPKEGGDGLIPPAWFDQARARYDMDPEWQEQLAADEETVLGLDVGDGRDPHALACRQGSLLRWVRTIPTTGDRHDDEKAVDAAETAARETDARLFVDRTGVGAGPWRQLARKLVGRVRPISFGTTPDGDPDMFANRQAELFWKLRERFRQGDIAIAPPPSGTEDALAQLRRELAEIRYTVDARGRIRIESKSDLRSRIGRSPDAADAVAMAFTKVGVTSIYRRGVVG